MNVWWVYIYIHTYIHTYIYIYIYTYIHTYLRYLFEDLNELVPVPKRNKSLVQTFGYDLSTLQALAGNSSAFSFSGAGMRGREALAAAAAARERPLKIERLNVLAQPEQTHERVSLLGR